MKDSTLSLKISRLQTKLGPMLAVADDSFLYFLEFEDCTDLDKKMGRLEGFLNGSIEKGGSFPIDSIEQELAEYFRGDLREFKTPLYLLGTSFQKRVWEELKKIPYGTCVSYSSLAEAVGKPKAYRAVANANASNSFPIIIPCHRVIYADSSLGGYNSGIARKKWLIEHESTAFPLCTKTT